MAGVTEVEYGDVKYLEREVTELQELAVGERVLLAGTLVSIEPKSGTVTRNSDILKALKSHGSDAQKRLLQTNKKAVVRVHYVVTAGQKSSTFHDGVFRPSSAEFWAQAFALDDDPELAVELTLAMAQVAGALLRQSGGEESLRALEIAVAAYIQSEEEADGVDWEYLARRNMFGGKVVDGESAERHKRAQRALTAAGFSIAKSTPRSVRDDQVAAELAEAAADLASDTQAALEEVLPADDRD